MAPAVAMACSATVQSFHSTRPAACRPLPRVSPRPPAAGRAPRRHRRDVTFRGLGEDVVGGFFDLAKLVAADGGAKKSLYEDLSYKIGQDVYADFGGWHLYLRDMKGTPDLSMAQVLANALGSKMSGGKFDEQDMEDLLKGIPVSLGAGKLKVPLYNTLPSFCTQDLARICEDYARDM